MAKVVGIDLGTTNSCAAVIVGGEPQIITNAEGGRITPSVVAFSKNGEMLVGEIAKRQAVSNPERTIQSVKRNMGTDWKIKIDDKDYTPQQISAFILQKIKRDVESYLGEKVEKAVVTVPAYFSDAQRQGTKDAGKIAGLEVLRIINEPTAAALAYGLDKEKEQTILVFDLGGGTFDVSVLEISEGLIEVVSTSGDNHLGGDDWDDKVVRWMAKDFKSKTGIDLSKDKMAMQRLNEAAEKAKCELSSTLQSNINLPFITADSEGPKHLDITLKRSEFQKMTQDLLEKCRGPMKRALSDAKKKGKKEIDHVILVGGATRMPAVVELVKEIVGKEPRKDINPDEVVALGAALQAGIITREVKEILLVDIAPLSLGIETKGGIFTKLIERNTSIPTKKAEKFTTAEDGQTSVEVHVLQGESEWAARDKTLGRFHLEGILPSPRGIPQIEVTFDIDKDGIVHVSAKDLGTGKEQKITITGSTKLPDEEIDKMVEEAEKHAEEDKKKKDLAEARNNADNLVYSVEKTLKEAGDKISEADKNEINQAVNEIKESLKTEDTEAIKKATENLLQASSKVAQAAYSEQQAQAQGGNEQRDEKTGEPRQDDNVVEGEIVDDESDKDKS